MVKKSNVTLKAALDIGSSKVTCFIAETRDNDIVQVVGIGHHVSQGVKAGVVTDISAAEEAIRGAVAAAEEMAGVNIDRVSVNVSGSQQKSFKVSTELFIGGQAITMGDIYRMAQEACANAEDASHEVIHCIPTGFAIDDNAGIKNPEGMVGNTLKATFHIVTVSRASMLNLANCMARCHLDIENYVVSALASSCACLQEDEKELGVVLIDFGADNTSLALFKDQYLMHVDTVALGGNSITNDVAVGLSTSIVGAERIKALYGAVTGTTRDQQEIIDIPQTEGGNEDEVAHVERVTLINIIRPRVEEILELAQSRLKEAGYDMVALRIVITGGGSQLNGLKEFIGGMYESQVRLGVPKAIEGVAESMRGPAFATCVGMLRYIVSAQAINQLVMPNYQPGFKGAIIRTIRWFKEHF